MGMGERHAHEDLAKGKESGTEVPIPDELPRVLALIGSFVVSGKQQHQSSYDRETSSPSGGPGGEGMRISRCAIFDRVAQRLSATHERTRVTVGGLRKPIIRLRNRFWWVQRLMLLDRHKGQIVRSLQALTQMDVKRLDNVTGPPLCLSSSSVSASLHYSEVCCLFVPTTHRSARCTSSPLNYSSPRISDIDPAVICSAAPIPVHIIIPAVL
ncbi:hypothetical protein N7510_003341 [Penicillium lagena]|uniref:uncharacterized protein n=1 Tax=Penicillium lagena TaxID=94218 RepID=UPI00253FE35A|nr:uncharacterized protein N7510_003341 [Penicillium lagena]KAJ5619357.1 hypothetical protein N7510_003341 [Penicillium lagena]